MQFDGPVLELLTESRTRFDRRLADARPGHPRARARRAGVPPAPARRRPDARDRRRAARPAHDRRHRQPVEVRGLLRRAASTRGGRRARVSDDEALAIVRFTRPRMQQSALDGMQDLHRVVYAKAGRPCPRCGAPIRSRGQGDDNRADVLVRGVPVVSASPNGRDPGAMRRVGHKGADHIAPGNTFDSFAAALRARRRHDRVRRPVRASRRQRRAAARPRLGGRRRPPRAHARGGPRALRRAPSTTASSSSST